MATIYKIHPAIGVARVGNSPTKFFIGPETPDSPGVEIGADGTETALTRYKQDGLVKRQAARFRVFAYEQDAAGNLELVGEVGADAQVAWTVDLVNRKAALNRRVGPAGPRNIGIADRDSLIIRGPRPATIAGRNRPAATVAGRFLGKEVFLGELRTDGEGRLIVLGGRGASGSVPPGRPLETFISSDRWHDDVSDGPVTATVTLPGQAPVVVHESAWVVVAPPDFAPPVGPIVSLYDVAFQAAIDKGALQPDVRPSFARHIKPMIQRTADMRWVDDWDEWRQLHTIDFDTLADPSPSAAAARKAVADRIRNPRLIEFEMPEFLNTTTPAGVPIGGYVTQWETGDFVNDLATPVPAESIPDQLDRIALHHCTGNNFFPGIEAGENLRDPNMYGRPFRLDPTNVGKVFPGCLTEIMALPWQADFFLCRGGGELSFNWWPTQRPDKVMTRPDRIPGSDEDWAQPIGDFKGMVDNALRLGFIVPRQVDGDTVVVETERDPQFPRRPGL